MTRMGVVGAAVLLIASTALAGTHERKDLQIFKDISTEVNRYTRFTVFDDVNASVENGLVTLTGKVTMPYKRDEIGERVAKVTGVRGLDNRIEVLPVSAFDDELRFRIARAIYLSPSFVQYNSVHAPIHIIVEHGRVTLTGVVTSEVDRMLVRSIASGFGAFSVTSELRTEAERRAELEAIGS